MGGMHDGINLRSDSEPFEHEWAAPVSHDGRAFELHAASEAARSESGNLRTEPLAAHRGLFCHHRIGTHPFVVGHIGAVTPSFSAVPLASECSSTEGFVLVGSSCGVRPIRNASYISTTSMSSDFEDDYFGSFMWLSWLFRRHRHYRYPPWGYYYYPYYPYYPFQMYPGQMNPGMLPYMPGDPRLLMNPYQMQGAGMQSGNQPADGTADGMPVGQPQDSSMPPPQSTLDRVIGGEMPAETPSSEEAPVRIPRP
jgi:hypothetical protein